MKIPLCSKCSGAMRPTLGVTDNGDSVERKFTCTTCGHAVSREGQPSTIKDNLMYLRVEAVKQTVLLQRLADTLVPASEAGISSSSHQDAVAECPFSSPQPDVDRTTQSAEASVGVQRR